MKRLFPALLVSNLLTALLVLSLGGIQAHEKQSSAMEKCHSMMMNQLGKADKNYDLRFINAMIPHHQGAVMMAKDALKKSQHSEIKTMAQDIIVSQEKEIDQMKSWRKAWYGK